MSTNYRENNCASSKSVRPKCNNECCGALGKRINQVGNEEHEEQEEAVKAKIATAGKRPTAIEVEEHMNTHLPYRSWCPHCVKAKARGTAQQQVKDQEGNENPVVSMDYMFFVKEKENEEENGLPTIVIKIAGVKLDGLEY